MMQHRTKRTRWASDRKWKGLSSINEEESGVSSAQDILGRRGLLAGKQTSNKETPLQEAVLAKELSTIRQVLRSNEEAVSESDVVGRNALHTSCHLNNLDKSVFSLLLSSVHNTSTLTALDSFGYSPLHYLWHGRRGEVMGFERVVRSTRDIHSANTLVRDLWTKTLLMVYRYKQLANRRMSEYRSQHNKDSLHTLCYLNCPDFVMELALKLLPDDLNHEEYGTGLSLSMVAAYTGASVGTIYNISRCEAGSVRNWIRASEHDLKVGLKLHDILE
jgi:ankyrin repeat protein